MTDRKHGGSSRQSKELPNTDRKANSSLRIISLFTGIAGIERGMALAGHSCEYMCEIDEGAREVLKKRFPDIPLKRDIRTIKSLPRHDLLAAGFPCNDLSPVGPTTGIDGQSSGLIREVFRLIERGRRNQRWLLLENVPFMLRLHQGKAIRYIVKWLDESGFTWAYRVIDTRAFGLPQRRRRVLLLASRTEDPREVLLTHDVGNLLVPSRDKVACGFYWTEGNRGLGWANNAIPTLKGGSSIGIPSAPAIWQPDGTVITPDIRDGERLQGFPAGWTSPASDSGKVRSSFRWKLIGNAVSVPVSKWIGKRLLAPQRYFDSEDICLGRISSVRSWPDAAWGKNGKVYRADVSSWPVRYKYMHLGDFLIFPGIPLREQATVGFLRRARASKLRFGEGFLEALDAHLERLRSRAI